MKKNDFSFCLSGPFFSGNNSRLGRVCERKTFQDYKCRIFYNSVKEHWRNAHINETRHNYNDSEQRSYLY